MSKHSKRIRKLVAKVQARKQELNNRYSLVDVVIPKQPVFRTHKEKGYHILAESFEFTIVWTICLIETETTYTYPIGTKWDGCSIPEIAECIVGEGLDPIWATESLVHDILCWIDFNGELRDKAFRLLLKRNPQVMKVKGKRIVSLMYTAVVQYREKKQMLKDLFAWRF